jgi:hypothetical protein
MDYFKLFGKKLVCLERKFQDIGIGKSGNNRGGRGNFPPKFG